MTFIRIGTKSSSSYIKATKQFNLRVLPPFIKLRQFSHNFLNSISTNVLDAIYWSKNEGIIHSEIERCRMYDNSSSISSKSLCTTPDNPPVL